jgi:ATP-binding cassette subfamily B protein
MGDATSIEHSISHVVPGLVAYTVVAIIAVILLAFYDIRLSIALFIPLPIALSLIFFSRKLQSSVGEKHVLAKLKVSDEIQEYLEGIKVVKAFDLSGEKSKSLVNALSSMKIAAILFEGVAGSITVLAMMILQVGIGLVTLVGVFLLTGESISPI